MKKSSTGKFSQASDELMKKIQNGEFTNEEIELLLKQAKEIISQPPRK